MKRALLLCALATATLAVPSAKADDFSISFNGGSLGFSGTGVFVGTETSSGVYDITGVLGGSVTDPGFGSSSIASISDYLGADNMLFYPDTGTGYFDGNGLSFTLANGVNINLYNDIESYGTNLDAIESNPNGDIPETVTESVAPVPEPSSLALLGTSAAVGLGFLRRRLFA